MKWLLGRVVVSTLSVKTQKQQSSRSFHNKMLIKLLRQEEQFVLQFFLWLIKVNFCLSRHYLWVLLFICLHLRSSSLLNLETGRQQQPQPLSLHVPTFYEPKWVVESKQTPYIYIWLWTLTNLVTGLGGFGLVTIFQVEK